jgi:hypothetical protein
MEYFVNYNKHISISKDILLLIKCSKPKTFILSGDSYKLFTYTLNIKGHEDDVYAKNPELLGILPRACSLLVSPNGSVEQIMGPSKFSGKSALDEDPETDNDESIKDPVIFDFSKVSSWAKDAILEIVETVKENGKFFIFRVTENDIILCGSKNYHIAFLPKDIDQIIEENKENNIMLTGLLDIKTNLEKLMNPMIREFFNQGYSLVGELCDGQHFFPIIPGQNAIKWFGLFKNGDAVETMSTLSLLRSIGIETVDFKIVFSSESDSASLDNVFKLSRCMNSEGSVLRCRNIITHETILVKSKSVKYIVWRITRQVLLHGYKNIEHLKKRFVDTSTYHGLNTKACIRIVRQLMHFGLWMISKEYPCSILGHTPVTSVRGKLPNGFCTYWTEYLEAGNADIEISLDEFGSFDESEFLINFEIYKKRMDNDPVYVFFFQGLQGSGKSTIAAKLCKHLNDMGISANYREQDTFWGDSPSCQGAIYHDIARADGPKVVFISRCNANSKQYDRYLQMLYTLPCVVSFIAPEKVDPLYLMISLSGIMNRSTIGDRLIVGRFEYPMSQVVEFTRKNYAEFVTHPSAWTVPTYCLGNELSVEALQLKTDTEVQTFVESHFSELYSLCLPVETIVDHMLEIVKKTMSGDVSHIIYNKTPVYIGLAVGDVDKQILQDFLDTNHKMTGTTSSYTIYNHHCTIEFGGGKKKVSPGQIPPGQLVTGIIDALVIRKSDGASSFRLSSLMINDQVVKVHNRQAHITAKIPSFCKPMCSNDFVGLSDESIVMIIPFHHTMSLNCFYSS